MTYGDGLSNINISELIQFHKNHGKLATVTAIQTPGRFGILDIKDDNSVTNFLEKPNNLTGRINGGFFVLQKEVLNYIKDENTSWEKEPLKKLSQNKELVAYSHDGFWQPCDTLRDKKRSFLIITHYQRLLDYIKPDFVHVLMKGKIAKTGCSELANELEKVGYENI